MRQKLKTWLSVRIWLLGSWLSGQASSGCVEYLGHRSANRSMTRGWGSTSAEEEYGGDVHAHGHSQQRSSSYRENSTDISHFNSRNGSVVSRSGRDESSILRLSVVVGVGDVNGWRQGHYCPACLLP